MRNLKIFLYLAVVYLGYVYYLTQYRVPSSKEAATSSRSSKVDKVIQPNNLEIKKVKPKVASKPKIPQPSSVPANVQEPKSLPEKNVAEIKLLELEEDFAPMTEKGELILSEVFIDGPHVLVHGDILISDLDEFNEKRMDEGTLLMKKPIPWPEGIVPYELSDDLDNPQAVLEAIEYFNQNTPVKFIKRRNQKGYLYFKKGLNNCYSYLGYQGKKQDISLSSNCQRPQILHELMHALGFFHEQNRHTRDQHIEVNWKNIDEKYHLNFKKIHPKGFLDPEADFDFESILLYPPFAFALVYGEHTMIKVNGELYRGNKTGVLSEGDLARVKELYSSKD